MTRPPLELLRQLQPEVETLLGFIRGAVAYHDGPQHVESVLDILTQNGLEKLDLLAVCSPHEARREALIHKLMAENAALRAQAEAGAGEIEALRVIPAADLRPGDRVLMDHGVVTLSCVTRPAIGGETFVRVVFSPANRYGDTSLDLIPTARYAVVGRPMREVQAAWDALTADQKRAALAQADAGGEA